MSSLFRAFGLHLRRLARTPGFTLTAILTLALGIGATTAIWTLLDRVALRPLSYPEAERLVWLDSPVPGLEEGQAWGLSEAGYHHFIAENRTFDAIGAAFGAFGDVTVSLIGDAGARKVDAAVVTPSMLDVLGSTPARGRLILPSDTEPGAPLVAVLSHGLWQSEFGGDPAVVGRTVEVEGQPAEIVGVMQPGVDLPTGSAGIWIPLPLDPSRPPVNSHGLMAVGRLRPGATIEDAQRDLNALTAQFPELFPSAYSPDFITDYGFRTRVMPLREHVVGDTDRTLWILLGAVALVLVIAFANTANLFLVRADARKREQAVRTALGATRLQLARNTLGESLVLALLAGGLGLFIAWVMTGIFLATAPATIPRLGEVRIGWSSAAFALLAALFGGVLFGIFPLVGGGAKTTALREGGRTTTLSRKQQGVRAGLVIGQIALALTLLAAAGLMLRSFTKLRSVDTGFNAAGVLTFDVSLPGAEYRTYEEVARFHRTLEERLSALPGVTAAGGSNRRPLDDTDGCAVVFLEDRPVIEGEPPCVATPTATPGYFRSLGIPVHGRTPDWGDVQQGSGAVVITQALADRFWPGDEAIGKGIRGNGWARPFYRVAGVAGDIRAQGLDQPPLEAVYFPLVPIEGAGLWDPARTLAMMVRAETASPMALAGSIRRIVQEIDPRVPVANIQTMEQVVRASPSMIRASLTMLLLGIAASMALFLSAVGIYGVISYVVGQRTAEIGIRMALGAGMQQVAGMVLRQSAILAVAGVAVGLVAAFAATRVLQSLLFETSATDPIVLGAVSLLLVGIAMLAAYLPARRAAGVDPMVALRAE